MRTSCRSSTEYRDSRRIAPVAALAFALSSSLPAAQQLPFEPSAGVPPPAPAARSVPAQIDTAGDALIEQRLVATFSNIDELQSVDVRVHAGVVVLGGEVLAAEARRRAEELALQIEGVTTVENEIVEVRDVRRRISPVVERLRDRGNAILNVLPLLVVALLIVVLFFFVGQLAIAWERPYRWLARSQFIRDLVRQAVRLTVVVVGLIVALEILDATTLVGAVLGTAGLAGLAIGFALRDLAENYISSVLLSLRRPFEPFDHVLIAGHEGKVMSLTSRATILMSLDGNHVSIPNSTVFKGTIVNYTKKPERRFEFDVGLGTSEDLSVALRVGVEVLERMEGVMSNPPPFGRVEELGDSVVRIRLYGWVDQARFEFTKVRSEAIRLVKLAYDKRGITMPEPLQRLRIESEDQTAPSALRAAGPEQPVDVAVDRHLDQEIEAERSVAKDEDLLAEKKT